MKIQIGVLNFFARDTEANDWASVISTNYSRIYNYFRYHGLDDMVAEDLTATTFEKAWRARNRFNCNKSRITTWLNVIAQRTMIDHFRSHRDQVSLDILDDKKAAKRETYSPEQMVEHTELFDRLRFLLANLSERERDLIALKYGAELSNREIAKKTGLSESNVGTLLFRIVKRLRSGMEVYSNE
jgi:RNA polymerase sigma-70 factor (ECF subfamily)